MICEPLCQKHYQGQGQVITSHRHCGMWLLVPALDTSFWHTSHHVLYIIYFRILLPFLNFPGAVCVEFWYHMYGFHIDELELFTRLGGVDTQVWNLVGQQGNFWAQQRVTIEELRTDQRVSVWFKGYQIIGKWIVSAACSDFGRWNHQISVWSAFWGRAAPVTGDR